LQSTNPTKALAQTEPNGDDIYNNSNESICGSEYNFTVTTTLKVTFNVSKQQQHHTSEMEIPPRSVSCAIKLLSLFLLFPDAYQ